MSTLERSLLFLFPLLKLRSTPWEPLWVQQERNRIIATTRVAMAIGCLIQIGHHFFVDRPLGLHWGIYRFGTAAFMALVFAATTLDSVRDGRWYRIPVIAAGVLMSFLQARTMTWWDGVPFIYAIILAGLSALLIQHTPLISAIYLIALFAIQMPAFLQVSVPAVDAFSAPALALLAVMFLRSRASSDINSFITEQEKVRAYKKLIESELAFANEVRAFLPKEIFNRTTLLQKQKRYSVLQAMDDELRPRIKNIACVFSDIRGFTESSKDLREFTVNSALPNIRICTDIIESERGIPRLVGDLVFGYFDFGSIESNLKASLQAAVNLVNANRDWNDAAPAPAKVRRYVLLSIGEAVVGNIGGGGSSREITALGSPVNVLSRIDQLTKHPKVSAVLSEDSIVMTAAAADLIRKQFAGAEMTCVDLRELGVSIRDFPEENRLFLLNASASNVNAIFATDDTSNVQTGSEAA